jgi:hypothetical protein
MILTPNKYYVRVVQIASKLHLIPHLKYDETARWLYTMRSLQKLFKHKPWTKAEAFYFQKAPKILSFKWLRPKLVVVATK